MIAMHILEGWHANGALLSQGARRSMLMDPGCDHVRGHGIPG